MLAVDNLYKSFGSTSSNLLDGVSFTLSEGQSLAIMGASGSGKSTLLNIIAGLLACDSGQICFDNQVLNALDTSALDAFRARQIGMVFQQFNLIDCLNVTDNITLPARYLGLEYASQLPELIDALGLKDHTMSKISQLSGGQQQRVAIARALIHKPRLILADEPTGNLDNQTSTEVSSLLYDMVAKSKTAMILVTHSDAVASQADRIFYLKQGKLVQ